MKATGDQPVKKNDELEVRITDLTDEGFGIGHVLEGYALFVRGALPGDLVIAHVTKVMKKYSYAIVSEYREKSPDRIPPECTACGKCGGCTLQELSRDAELEFKRKKVEAALSRMGGFSGLSVPLPVSGSPTGYRNKAELPVGINKDGDTVAGYYAVHSHRIVSCDDCIIEPEGTEQIKRSVLDFMNENGIRPYDSASRKGLVRHIVVRRSKETGETLLCIVVNGRKPGKLSGLRIDGVSTFCVNYNDSDTNVIFGSRTEVIYGSGYITERIGGLKYRIYAASFFQVNTEIAEKLYETVKGYVFGWAGTGEERLPAVWDLYCGAGTIGLYVADCASAVSGIEVSPVSIASAGENARDNGISNAEFIQGKAEDKAQVLLERSGAPDIIILDPPRKGCDTRLLDTVLTASPKQVIYVSCNPATLARDLKHLSGVYSISDIRLFDMFPNSGHVETVVLLTRQNT